MTLNNYDPYDSPRPDDEMPDFSNPHPFGVPEGQKPGPYQHYQPKPPVPPRRTGSSSLAAVSMMMAVCSFLFMLSMGSVFFGSLGILFALLSRGAGRMSGTAKAGLIGSLLGMIAGICVYIFMIFQLIGSGQIQQYEQYYQQYLPEYQINTTPDTGNTI